MFGREVTLALVARRIGRCGDYIALLKQGLRRIWVPWVQNYGFSGDALRHSPTRPAGAGPRSIRRSEEEHIDLARVLMSLMAAGQY